jgi:ABC-2 type transport system ATP-binding protein
MHDSHAASPPAIEVEHLTKVYRKTTAVNDISFAVARRSVTALLGGNGAGKTTTIGMIMGLVRPTSGSVRVLGHNMPDESAEVLGRMNFESPYVDMPMRLTVRQNLTVFGRLYAVQDLRARIDQLAADLELNEFLDRPSGNLSAGQKTRNDPARLAQHARGRAAVRSRHHPEARAHRGRRHAVRHPRALQSRHP